MGDVAPFPRLKGSVESAVAVLRSAADYRHLSPSDEEVRAMAERVYAATKDSLSTEKWVDCLAEELRKYEHG